MSGEIDESGPEHQDPRRPEDRVPHEASNRRVEPGDRWEPGELRVGHALRHENRREHDAGHGIRRQPLTPVRTRDTNPGHPTRHRFHHGHEGALPATVLVDQQRAAPKR